MPDRHIFHLSIPVRELQEAKHFYVGVLDARVGRENAEWLDVLLWGHQITLQRRPDEVPPPGEHGKRHFGVVLPWNEWERAVARIEQAGIGVLGRPSIEKAGTEDEHGKLYLQDPSGNVIEVKAYRNVEQTLGLEPSEPMPPEELKLELVELGAHLRAGMVVLWDAFKTYFTIVALLFAGCGFLLSKQSPFSAATSTWLCLFVSVSGLAITVLGASGMRRILAYQRAFIDRGVKLEMTAKTKIFDAIHRNWAAARGQGSDTLTYSVFGLFGLAWFALAVICGWCVVLGTGCPTPSCAGP